MDYKAREREEELKKMKAQLERTVDINYKRYNNEYMEVAGEHMMDLKKVKKAKSDEVVKNISEETADRLYNKLRGTIIV